MKPSIICAVALLSLCLPGPITRANDSAFSGVGGTAKPMRGEHATVAMQSEKIVIVADAKGYSTDVEFVFRNSGGKTSVQMGFPETSSGDVEAATKSVFLRFATFVDGRKIAAKRIITSKDSPETEAFWVKTVDFAAKQTRRVRVSYRSPWGGNTEWGTRNALIYDFTGKNWRGLVERSDIEIRVVDPGLWMAAPRFDNAPIPMSYELSPSKGTPRVAIFRKTWRNWQAQGYLMFGLTRMVPFWMLDRAHSGMISGSAETLKTVRTFRLGAVPAELPIGADAPPAFVRDGQTYVMLSHLSNRLGGFANDLEKHRGLKTQPVVELKWDEKTRVTTLTAGAKKVSFAPNLGVAGTPTRPILLRGQYGDSLYVPLAPIAKTLGLEWKADPKARMFDLKRGSWMGQ